MTIVLFTHVFITDEPHRVRPPVFLRSLPLLDLVDEIATQIVESEVLARQNAQEVAAAMVKRVTDC